MPFPGLLRYGPPTPQGAFSCRCAAIHLVARLRKLLAPSRCRWQREGASNSSGFSTAAQKEPSLYPPLAARGLLSPVRGEGLGRAADSRPYARTERPLCLLSRVRATAGTSPFRGGQGRGRDPSSASPPQDDTSFVTALAESAPRHLLLEEKATNGRPQGHRAPL